jgi:hypothetical protein
MTATGYLAIRTTLRTGLGPYMSVRISLAPPYMDPAEVQVPVWDLNEESGCGHIFGFYDGRQSEAPEP